MFSNRKRKYKVSSKRWDNGSRDLNENPPDPDPALFIQAFEADVDRGPQAWHAAMSLEVHGKDKSSGTGAGLIQWSSRVSNQDSERTFASPDSEAAVNVWVDRYDARLLLDSLPDLTSQSELHRLSPTGWSDLPSDSEDTFFLNTDEVDDYRREKRRKLMDQNREERLRALREEDCDHVEKEEDRWGGSDEEPDEGQREFMRRTASQILASSNSAQLEMRILANHGADPRFAFLRGRWSRAWKTMKGRIRIESASQKLEITPKGMGGLAEYGDSDGSDDENSGDHEMRNKAPMEPVTIAEGNEGSSSTADDAAVKEARRARAKEWAEKRRALKSQDDG